jgi:hypothetical protein
MVPRRMRPSRKSTSASEGRQSGVSRYQTLNIVAADIRAGNRRANATTGVIKTKIAMTNVRGDLSR